MVKRTREQRLREVDEVLRVRTRTLRWGYAVIGVAATMVIIALGNTFDGHDWRDRLGAIALGLLAWVVCTTTADSLRRPLLARGQTVERTQVVTSAVLGALQVVAAYLIGTFVGDWSAVAAGAGWLTGGAIVTGTGLLQWLAALARPDAAGKEARAAALATPPHRLAQQAGLWLLIGVTFAMWVGALADQPLLALAALVLQAALLGAMAVASQGRRVLH